MVLVVVGVLIWNFSTKFQQHDRAVNFSEFMSWADAGTIAHVTISGQDVSGVTKANEAFHTYVPSQYEGLVNKLIDRGIVVTAKEPTASPWASLLYSWAPVLLMIGFWIFFMRQMQSGGNKALSFGKSKAKLSSSSQKKVTFKDVAGVDEAKEELQEIIEFLKEPQKFQKLGGRIPKGVLLMGSPGTGKTLLAKAVAGEANVPFVSISGSDFVEMFVGVGASRVRDLFEQGKKNAPCIVFIDEIDAVGRHRGAGLGGGHDEREQTLNQLLVEMDGFESNEGVILVAATNRPDVLDPALLRPGRFDRRIVVNRPDVKGREGILAVHTRKIPMADDVEIAVLARGSAGFSGADLAILLGGRIAEEITMDSLTTGAGNDLERATELARRMVCEWGMSDAMGPLTFGKKEEQIFLGREIAQHQDYSEDTALKIDQEVKRFVTASYDRSHKLLTENKATLVKMADELLAREVLDAEQVKRIVAGLPLEDAQPALPRAAAPVEEDEARPHKKERAPIVPALNKPLPQE